MTVLTWNSLRPRPKLLVLLIVATAVLAVATAAVALGRPFAALSSHKYVANGLLTPNRDRLAVCVQPVGAAGMDAAEARRLVQEAIGDASKHPKWGSLGFGVAAPVVDAGCPSTPYLLRPGVIVRGGYPVGDPTLTAVAQPSNYRVFIFVLPPAEIARIFGSGASIRRVAEEFVCERGQCAEVTTGLYFSPQELRDEPFRKEWVERALGLEPTAAPRNAPVEKRNRP